MIWNTGTEIVALTADLGATVWAQPIALGNSQVAVANGLAWAAGTGRLVALNLADGSIGWQKQASFIPAGGYAGPILTDAAGGVLILKTARDQLIGFANETLPTRPMNLKAEPRAQSIHLTWDAPPPLPVDPPPAFYIICRQGGYGTATPLADQALRHQEAVLARSAAKIALAKPGTPASPSLPDEVVVTMPDNRTDPPTPAAFVVPATVGVLEFEDTVCDPTVDYEYQVICVDAAGVATPPIGPVPPVQMTLHPLGIRGILQPGSDWLADQYDEWHTGWNPRERVSWSFEASRLLSGIPGLGCPFMDAFMHRFTFTGPPGTTGVTFTTPVASQGVVYTGGSDGRLYALNGQTGELMWWVATGGPIRYPPGVGQGRTEVGGIRAVVGETVSAVSDDGNLYRISVDVQRQYPRRIEKHPFPGQPICAPDSGGRFYTRGLLGTIWDCEAGGCSDTGRRDSGICFSTPSWSVFNTGTGAGTILVPGYQSVYFAAGGPLLPTTVRPSGVPFPQDGAGMELLVAGFKDG